MANKINNQQVLNLNNTGEAKSNEKELISDSKRLYLIPSKSVSPNSIYQIPDHFTNKNEQSKSPFKFVLETADLAVQPTKNKLIDMNNSNINISNLNKSENINNKTNTSNGNIKAYFNAKRGSSGVNKIEVSAALLSEEPNFLFKRLNTFSKLLQLSEGKNKLCSFFQYSCKFLSSMIIYSIDSTSLLDTTQNIE